MHGILFAELKKYVVARLGAKAWNDLLAAAGMKDRVFMPNQVYPDADLVRLVSTASELTGKSAQDLLEDFGAFIAPDLLSMYRPQIDPSWKSLDVIQNTEQLIHRNVRVKTPGAEPPRLQTTREGPDDLRLVYGSGRHLCSVAKGIAAGIAREYHEQLRVTERTCMLRGEPACDIHIHRLA
jgi:hypothetical protein